MAPATSESHEVVIEAIGARGDGVARLAATRIFVPLAAASCSTWRLLSIAHGSASR